MQVECVSCGYTDERENLGESNCPVCHGVLFNSQEFGMESRERLLDIQQAPRAVGGLRPRRDNDEEKKVKTINALGMLHLPDDSKNANAVITWDGKTLRVAAGDVSIDVYLSPVAADVLRGFLEIPIVSLQDRGILPPVK
jgi:hypothetical protein